jgi:hypothetical protein
MGGEVLVLGIVGLLTWLIPFFVVMCSLGLFLSGGYSIVTLMVNTPTTTTSTPLPGDGGPLLPPVDTGPVEWAADGEITFGEYDDSQLLAPSYEIFWNSDSEYIYVGIQVRTDGWVAVGLQPDIRSNTNVDMIMGFVVGGNEVFIYDLFNAEYPGLNPQDAVLGGTSDILLAGGKEGQTVDAEDDDTGNFFYTTIEFMRKLNTGDQYDQIFFDGPNTIIWAYSNVDSRDAAPFDQGYGVLEVN